MSKALKAWLWVILVLNSISAVISLIVGFWNPLSWLSTAMVAIFVLGIALLLFKRKKLGFYFMIAAQLMGLITNLNLGDNLFSAAVSSALPLLITYWFMKNDWKEFQ